MKWVTEDGAVQIDAIFSDGELAIEGNVREGKDLTDAIKASYQLVGHLSKMNPTGLTGRVAFFSLGPGSLDAQLGSRLVRCDLLPEFSINKYPRTSIPLQ